MPSASPELYTLEEVAALLKVQPKTLYMWRYRRVGPPATKVGRLLRYERADLQAWLESQKVEHLDRGTTR